MPEITADPAQLSQVLVNLVVNALQSIRGAGRITVETRFFDNSVYLVVADTGTGMSKQVLEKIFVPFFTTKDVGQGTGLGLPVVHGIVTAHSGSIDVESKEGHGTRFEIRLPIGKSHSTEENG
jgi:signal transduction histidine kinase